MLTTRMRSNRVSFDEELMAGDAEEAALVLLDRQAPVIYDQDAISARIYDVDRGFDARA